MIVGELICITGTAFLTRLEPTISVVGWAAPMVAAGIGMGMAMQLPYTAVQVVLQYVLICYCLAANTNGILSQDDISTGNGVFCLDPLT
jgi:uncharacterized membrane protein